MSRTGGISGKTPTGLPATIGAMRQDPTAFRLPAILNSLRACPLFAGVSVDDLESLAEFVVLKAVKKGGYLFHEGAPAEGFYVVQTGSINVHRVSPTGREQVISVFRAGQSFAEAAVASHGGYPADARAIEPSNVLLVPKADFIELLRKRPELALRMLASMSQHLRVIVGLLDDLTLKDVETRLAHWLLKRCKKPPGAAAQLIHLEGTKRVLAAELGTTSETLSRTLAKFRDSGLLIVSGKAITLPKPIAIEQLLRRNLGEV
ncbi:MAG: Crp/Fnr family transcriptional regulator [Verrucomicrobia bacterium]|nr:Crp/Fnr family transcriptional regulator [Verrucomicrobiota bacterium]